MNANITKIQIFHKMKFDLIIASDGEPEPGLFRRSWSFKPIQREPEPVKIIFSAGEIYL